MRTLLVINARLDPRLTPAIAADRQPRKDYLELCRALTADVLDLDEVSRSIPARLAARVMGNAAAQALLAMARAGRYDQVFVDRESAGFLLGALLHLRRHRPRLAMIGHLLSPSRKRWFFRTLRLRRTVDQLIVHSSVQRHVAERDYDLPAKRITLVPYQTDERFWHPIPVSSRRLICSAGLEYRDYDTLIDAVDGLDVELVIAAASHWSSHQALPSGRTLPANVRIVALDYAALRELYAESLCVVVPLLDAENQAGITTILEAMAMGKAVVVSHTRGQIDVVRDRRRLNRAAPERPTQPLWATALGATEDTAQGHTGIYVRPGDAAELRRALDFLINHPDQARKMGVNGRHLVEETMSLDLFTARLAALLDGERQDARPLSSAASGS